MPHANLPSRCLSFLTSALVLGVIFAGMSLTASATVTESTIFTFTDNITGGPNYSLSVGRDGLLYGTTVPVSDGTGMGTFFPAHIFSLTTSGTYHSLYTLPGNPVSESVGGPPLLQGTGTDTNFYGVLSASIFRISTSGAFSTLKTYTSDTGAGQADGGEPVGLIHGSDGNFYGVCSAYGAGSNEDFLGTAGVVFRLTPAGAYTVLHNFSDTSDPSYNPDNTVAANDGFEPVCNLVQGKDGNFYGTTQLGGTYSWGTVFKMTPAGHVTILKNFDFTVGDGGAEPECGLVFGPDGTTLYGRTTVGNVPGFDSDIYGGTLFSITTSGVFKTLHTWNTVAGDATSEAQDQSGLILAGDGNFYGTANQGLFFQLTPAGTYTILYNFNTDGQEHYVSGMTQGLDGSFYGFNGYTAWKINTGLGGGTTTAAPVITSATTATATVGKAFSYQITATNTPTSYAISTSDTTPLQGLTYTQAGVFSGIPATAGTYHFTLSAKNASGTGTSPLTITVSAATVAAPVITSATTATATVGKAFSYQITATNTPTSYAISTSDTTPLQGLTYTQTGVFSGIPATAGTYHFTLSAKNAGGTGTSPLTITVSPAATVAHPVITSILTAAATITQAFTYQITATNTPTSFKATGLPPGVTVGTTTGKISGTPTVAGAFNITLTATNAGGSGTALLALTVAKKTQTITFPVIPAKTVTSTPFALTATASSELAITFTLVSGPAKVTGNTVTLTGVAGTVTIQAAQAGNTTYAAATSVRESFTVSATALKAQTIAFNAIPSLAANHAPFKIDAVASSGLAVTFTVISGPATVSGSTVTLTGVAGTVTIQASQAGNTTYAAATSVRQTFTVTASGAPKTQTVTFAAIPTKVTTAAPFTIVATASSGLSVTVAVLAGPATISGKTVTLTGQTGVVILDATQAGNSAWSAASAVQSFSVELAQTITFPAIANKLTTSASFTPAATASSGLAVQYSIVSGPATVSGSTVKLTGAVGTVIVAANQYGNGTYVAAPTVQRSFTVTAP